MGKQFKFSENCNRVFRMDDGPSFRNTNERNDSLRLVDLWYNR